MKKNNIGKIIYKIVGYILNLLLIIISIVILVGMYYIYQIKIMKNDYANMFGYTFFEVATGSMSPTLEVGDIVVVKISKEIETNDIIVYKDNNDFITHRLVEKKCEKLITKGDANNTADGEIELNNLLGKVIKIIPKIGIWRKIILTPEVIGLIIMLIIMFGFIFICNSKLGEKNEK